MRSNVPLLIVGAMATFAVIKLFTPTKYAENIITEEIPPVEHILDKNGELQAKVSVLEVEYENNKRLIDSLSRALKVKPKQIKGIDKYIERVDTVLVDSIVYIQGPDSVVISKKDAWVNIKAVGKSDSSYIEYSSIDTITRVEVSKSPLFGRASTEIFLHNSNPYNKITNGSSFKIREKQIWLSLGPSIQFDPFTRKVSVGISIQVPLIKFRR